MKILIITALMVTALMVSVASAANQYAEESAKLKDVVSTSFGLAAFRPIVTTTDGQIHITLSPTQIGDYPTLMDVRAIIELYYKTVDGTGYAGSLVLVIKNLDGIGAYRWDVRPYSKDDFDAQPNYVIDNMLKLNPGPEGVGGSSAWIYTDPNYVASKPAVYASSGPSPGTNILDHRELRFSSS
jgi:hypothetical protein